MTLRWMAACLKWYFKKTVVTIWRRWAEGRRLLTTVVRMGVPRLKGRSRLLWRGRVDSNGLSANITWKEIEKE